MLTVVTVTSHPETLRYLTDKLLKDNGVTFSAIEGSLLTEITLHDINYADAIVIKDLHIKYNIFMLFNPTPTVKRIKVHGATINLSNLPKNEDSNSTFSMFPFALSQLHVSDTHVLLDDKMLSLDVNASKIHYRRQLNVKKLSVGVSSAYGKTKIKGSIKNNRLIAKSHITPAPSLYEQYMRYFKGLTQSFVFDLEATLERIKLHTHFDRLDLRADQNMSFKYVDIDLTYLVKEKYLDAKASYNAEYDQFEAKVKQKGRLLSSLAYTSELNATVIKHPIDLPFNTFEVVASGDMDTIKSKLFAGPLEFSLDGQNYKEFIIHAESKKLPLLFMTGLPEVLNKESVSISADASLRLSPFIIKGKFETENIYSTVDGTFELNKDDQRYLANLHPKLKAEVWKKYPIEKFSPVRFTYDTKNAKSKLTVDAKMLTLALVKKENALRGQGSIGSATFNVRGRVENEDNTLEFSVKAPSLDTLLAEFELKDPQSEFTVDAEVDMNATLSLSENIVLKSRINVPWFIIKPDMRTTYKGEDLYFESTLIDENISIDNYSFTMMNHHVYSQRPSKILRDTNGSIDIKEFWVYDNLLLTGTFNPERMLGTVRAYSDSFNYESEEGNITLKADIKADFESNGRQNIEGSITLLDGIINYEPTTDYTISDDIIIIQDIKPYSQNRLYINIRIDSLKPIRYKTKEIDVRFNPDIILWQEPGTPLAIYGLIMIEEGEVNKSGKRFELDKSEIYFNGANPIDPYLNLNIHYQTLDNIDIEIFITNTLGNPVIVLSSNPVMSQNDIMSYILFGEAANSAFDNSGTGSNTAAVSSLLLATGLKQIFNDTAGVNIDTLNILTNEEGTLGYEIGTRFNKNMRVLYKNDTISSVILQYSLSRSIRFDIDVHETGQGVSILYVKDF